MTGVILCGGLSSRMGADKGLLKQEAGTWAQIAFDKLSSLGFPVVFSVNKNQFSSYAAIVSADKLITDDESLLLRGPLLGTLSVHLQLPGEDIFILACDMPLMDIAVLKQLQQAYQTNLQASAFVFTNDNEPEPLCGIYKSQGLDVVLEMYRSKQLVKHSMKFMLDHIDTFTIPLREEQKKFFRNFNAHAELNGL
jgi:molybdenum cofactor guanylyltransferase